MRPIPKFDVTCDLSGWLTIDKPSGITSARAIARVKKCFNLKRRFKVGHAGTLDPLATGVLPVAMGEATKVVRYVTNAKKTYTVSVKWGEATDTDDADGKIINKTAIIPNKRQIIAALPSFTGKIKQIPPNYSAVKVKGKRAYILAREDIELNLKPREVMVDKFVLDQFGGDSSHFIIDCGKGTYVRALVRDLALAMGSLGHVTSLRRTRVGPFRQEISISLDNLDSLRHSAARLELLFPVDYALADIPALELTEIQAANLSSGQQVAYPFSGRGLVRAKSGSRLVAMAEADGSWLRPTRVFNH